MEIPAARTLPALLDEMAARLPAHEFVVAGDRRCRDGLAACKTPAHWWFVRAHELPRTATGKVQKFRLRELFLARLQSEG